MLAAIAARTGLSWATLRRRVRERQEWREWKKKRQVGRCSSACSSRGRLRVSSTSEWCAWDRAPPPATLNMFCTATDGRARGGPARARGPLTLLGPGWRILPRLDREERVERLHEGDAGGGHVAQVTNRGARAEGAQILLGAFRSSSGRERGRPRLSGRRLAPSLVAITDRVVGCRASTFSRFGDKGAVNQAVSMKLMPAHGAAQDFARPCRIIRSPQASLPARRMAP